VSELGAIRRIDRGMEMAPLGQAGNRWVDDAVVAVLRQNCVKKSGHTFSGTQIHAPEKVCHNGDLMKHVTC
jgi:hypothetical protein